MYSGKIAVPPGGGGLHKIVKLKYNKADSLKNNNENCLKIDIVKLNIPASLNSNLRYKSGRLLVTVRGRHYGRGNVRSRV
jgi:hypothetical protein